MDVRELQIWSRLVRDHLLGKADFWRWGRDSEEERIRFHGQCLRALGELGFRPPDGQWQAWGWAVADYITKLGPLTPYLERPEVTDVQLRGGRARVVTAGRVEDLGEVMTTDEAESIAYRLAVLQGVRLGPGQPKAVIALPDGLGRATVVVPPLVDEVVLDIRRPSGTLTTLDDLVDAGTLDDGLAHFLADVIPYASTLIGGAKGSGKTTFMSILTGILDPRKHVTVVESPFRELVVRHPWATHITVTETAPVTAERMIWEIGSRLPGGLIVGEIVYDGDAAKFLEVLRLGTRPAMATIHAGSGKGILHGLDQKVWRDLGQGFHEVLGANIDLLIYLHELADGRRIVGEVLSVEGWDITGQRYKTNDLFVYNKGRWEARGKSERLEKLLAWG